MDLYTIDTETFYSKEYSLSKITTEEYVRDSRFELIGLSIKKNDKKTKWLSGDILDIRGAAHHRLVERCYPRTEHHVRCGDPCMALRHQA